MVSENDPRVISGGYQGYAYLIKVKDNGGWDTRAADIAKARNKPSSWGWDDYERERGAQVGTQEQFNKDVHLFSEATQAAYANRSNDANDVRDAKNQALAVGKAKTPAEIAAANSAAFAGAYDRGWTGPVVDPAQAARDAAFWAEVNAGAVAQRPNVPPVYADPVAVTVSPYVPPTAGGNSGGNPPANSGGTCPAPILIPDYVSGGDNAPGGWAGGAMDLIGDTQKKASGFLGDIGKTLSDNSAVIIAVILVAGAAFLAVRK